MGVSNENSKSRAQIVTESALLMPLAWGSSHKQVPRWKRRVFAVGSFFEFGFDRGLVEFEAGAGIAQLDDEQANADQQEEDHE